LTQVTTTLVKSLSLLQKYKQKMITHNGDNYANKFYNIIYLDDNNKVNIKKNKEKYNAQYSGIQKKKDEYGMPD
jgi:hypothetical protein